VIRYFGRHLLGKKGLIRAYHQAASLAIDNATIGNYEKMLTLEFCVPFDSQATFFNMLAQKKYIVESVQSTAENLLIIANVEESFLLGCPYPYQQLKIVYCEVRA
jgi:putative IMPACT (imprinted ancient) family translation regulator